MNSDEKRLIDQLAEQLSQAADRTVDSQAEVYIRKLLAAQPLLGYRLVQHAVLQEIALQEAQRRIAELERSVPTGGGSFLGRVFGSAAPACTPPSPPQAAPVGAAYGGGSVAGSGGFLRSVAGTAAGVAAGALLFNGIERMFGGGFGGGLGMRPTESVENNTVINGFDDRSDPWGGNALAGAGWSDGEGLESLQGASADSFGDLPFFGGSDWS